MLIKLGIKELRRNKTLNILIILLLTVIFVILTLADTIIIKSTQKYNAICKLMSQNGNYYGTDVLFNQETMLLIKNKQELIDILGENVDVQGQYVLPGAHMNGELANIWSYDWKLIECYCPNIVEGRWFQKKDIENTDILYGVTIEDGIHSVGDRVTITNWDNNVPVEVEIIGLIKDNSSIIGYDPYKKSNHDYTDCYYTYELQQEQVPLLLLANDQLEQNLYFTSEEVEGIVRQQSGALFLTWNSKKTECEKEINQFMFETDNLVNYTEPFEEMKIKSKENILKQIYRYLPIIICSFVLTLIVTVSIGTISVKRQLHNYAIYNLCGLHWNNCIYISFVNSLICALTAFIVSHLGMVIAQGLGFFSNMAFEISCFSIGTCVLIIILYIGSALILPSIIIRGTTIKTILIYNRE